MTVIPGDSGIHKSITTTLVFPVDDSMPVAACLETRGSPGSR